jgi:hypothetical protein
MKCPHCNQEHPDNANFCTNTGQRLEPARYCPNCADRLPPGESTCPTCGTSLGWVAYPPTEKAAAPVAVQPAPPPTGGSLVVTHPKKRRSLGRLFACGCLGVPAVLLLLLALFVVIDPFGLHLWGRVNGKYDAALEVMPPETGVYIGINLLSATPAELEWISQSFTASLVDPARPVSSASSLLAAPALHPSAQISLPTDLLQQVQEATGFSIPNDLIPWVGQYGGIGLLDIRSGRSGQPVTSGWVIAIEARSGAKADEFLQTLRRNVANRRDISFTTQVIDDHTVTVHDVSADRQRLAFTRAGRMVLIASNLDGIRQMLSAQEGQSLAQDAVYQQLNALRPREWSFSLYINGEESNHIDLDRLASSVPAEVFNMLLTIPDTDAWDGVLVNGAVVSTGLRLDAYTAFSPGDLPDANLEILQSLQPDLTALQHVPDNAFVYTTGPRLDLLFQSIFESEGMTAREQERFQDDFADLFGFDLQADLFDHLEGNWILYAAPHSRGANTDTLDLPVALALLAPTNDPRSIEDTVDQLTSVLEDSFLTIEQDSSDGINWNEASTLRDAPFLFYGLGEGIFFIGTDRDVLEAGLTTEDSLLAQPGYLQLMEYIPDDLALTFYVNLDELYDIIRGEMSDRQRDDFDDTIAPFRAIQGFALAASLAQPDVLHTALVIGLPPR